jgi:hypothetical protein
LDVWPQQHLFLWLAAFAESLRRWHQSHDDWPRVARGTALENRAKVAHRAKPRQDTESQSAAPRAGFS